MKKLTLYTTVIFLLLNLAGCNTDDENVSEVPQDVPVEENQTKSQNGTNQTTDSPFHFTHFDLDVDYSENQDYDVDYENERESMEAEIDDDKGNNHLKGEEAFNVLRSIFEQLTFDQNTPNEDVISETIKAFNLDEDFQKFELEVQFTDGTEKEYKR